MPEQSTTEDFDLRTELSLIPQSELDEARKREPLVDKLLSLILKAIVVHMQEQASREEVRVQNGQLRMIDKGSMKVYTRLPYYNEHHGNKVVAQIKRLTASASSSIFWPIPSDISYNTFYLRWCQGRQYALQNLKDKMTDEEFNALKHIRVKRVDDKALGYGLLLTIAFKNDTEAKAITKERRLFFEIEQFLTGETNEKQYIARDLKLETTEIRAIELLAKDLADKFRFSFGPTYVIIVRKDPEAEASLDDIPLERTPLIKPEPKKPVEVANPFDTMVGFDAISVLTSTPDDQ